MNILLLSINYSPEPTGFAPHAAAASAYFVRQGHRVTVITGFPFAPYWKRWPAYRRKFIARETIDGVKVIRLTHFIPRRAGQMIQRLFMEGSFCLLAGLVGILNLYSCNVIVYVGAQPSIAMLAKVMGWLRRVPYVVNINDLAAQAAADVEMVKFPWLQKILDRFEFSAYRAAGGAMVLCDSFREALIADDYPGNRIRVIRSPVDLNLIRPLPAEARFRNEHNLSPDDFVVLFSGSMGLKQGLTNVIEAAQLLREERPSVKWILVGDGELMPTLQKLIAKYDLAETVRLLPLQPEAEMSAMFSSAEVLLLNQLSNMKDTVIPSKLLTYMAAGRPVLAAVNESSEAAALVRNSHGGIIVHPEDPTALATAVNQLQTDRTGLAEMGRRNRQYAEKHFDQEKIVAAQEKFLLEVVNKRVEYASATI
jgi:colanic acid biosynthesis glycosyl transferase WcaI